LISDDSVIFSDEGGNRKFCKEKPMDSFDFKRVEEELQEQLKPGVIGFPGLVQQQGWSTGGFNGTNPDNGGSPYLKHNKLLFATVYV